MPFWKKKQEISSDQRVMICPNCHQGNLRYASRTGIILGQPKLLCPDCGYQGYVFIDINPANVNEKELELEFLRDNPDFLESRKPAWQLAQESLEKKWKPNQKDNHNTLRAWCPFCKDVEVICSICQCPSEICANNANEGWIGELNKNYDDETELCDVDPILYEKIVRKFEELVRNHK